MTTMTMTMVGLLAMMFRWVLGALNTQQQSKARIARARLAAGTQRRPALTLSTSTPALHTGQARVYVCTCIHLCW